jgi:oxygen-independent coproporphyrinogen-3 oxidase
VQAIINRYQSPQDTHRLFDYCRATGFQSINIDLIYGLPLQTAATFTASLDQVLAMRPDRVALYSFAFVPWKQGNQRTMTEDMMLPPEEKLALYVLGMEKFLAAGYRQIGMDHFALPTDELAHAQEQRTLHRNFMGYTTKPANDMIAFGISGIGDLQGAYVQNLKEHDAYYAALGAGQLPTLRGVVLDRDDAIRRVIITALMCNFWLDIAAVEQRFGIDFATTFAPELTALGDFEREGFVRVAGGAIEVLPLGRVFVRNICLIFDRYRRAPAAGPPIFSRTV